MKFGMGLVVKPCAYQCTVEAMHQKGHAGGVSSVAVCWAEWIGVGDPLWKHRHCPAVMR